MRIVYFVHDLNDAAVHRRVAMLLAGGAEVSLLGFRRTDRPVRTVAGIPAVDLGRTASARMGQRALAVLMAAQGAAVWRQVFDGAAIIIARNLEMLLLAAFARRRFAPFLPLVFECLDIHRLMLAKGPAGAALRAIERRLVGSCAMLVVSSPRFLIEYFHKVYKHLPPVRLIENKVLAVELGTDLLARADARHTAPAAADPPWRIGWFGEHRCPRSLKLLADLAGRFPGRVEVVLRGRPARNVLPDFDAVVAATPGLSFLGPYDRRTELSRIYGEVHFTWAMDFFDPGANSDWLLPNRLYEGSLFGAVPLALTTVEVGRWLAARRGGVLLAEPLDEALAGFFGALSGEVYAELRNRMARVPLSALVDDSGACADFVSALAAARRHSKLEIDELGIAADRPQP